MSMNTEILLSIVITQHGEDYDIQKYYNIEEYDIFSHVNEQIEIILTEDLIESEPLYINTLQKKGLNIKFIFSKKKD